PVAPVAVYQVRAAVAQPVLRAEPPQVCFGEVPLGASPGQRLKLLQPDGSPWPASAPVTLESARGLIEAEAIRVRESSSAEALVLEVRPRADLPAGSFDDTLRVRSPDGRGALSVSVLGHVVP